MPVLALRPAEDAGRPPTPQRYMPTGSPARSPMVVAAPPPSQVSVP